MVTACTWLPCLAVGVGCPPPHAMYCVTDFQEREARKCRPPPTRVVVKFGEFCQAARHACRECLAGKLDCNDCEVKFHGHVRPGPLPPLSLAVVKFGVVQGPSEVVRHACRQCRAGNLARCDCEVKFPGNRRPRRLLPPVARLTIRA